MIAVSKENRGPFLYLLTVGAVAAATVAVFFGIGFLWLAPPHPPAPSADPIARAQAPEPAQALEPAQAPEPAQALEPSPTLETRYLAPAANSDAAWGSSSVPIAEEVTASATPSASNRTAPVLEGTGFEAARLPPTGITHAKRIRTGRRRHQATARHWVAPWRADASAGPNPGGGFYGPPNINVGYVNPR
jgi:hypothetical protein